MNEHKLAEFHEYVLGFYGTEAEHDALYPMGATLDQVRRATVIMESEYKKKKDVAYDSIDRERVRDIMINEFGLEFPDNPGDD